MAVRDEWIGKSLRELELRRRYSISVIALHNMLTDEITSALDPDARLKDSDTLLVAGEDEFLAKAARES